MPPAKHPRPENQRVVLVYPKPERLRVLGEHDDHAKVDAYDPLSLLYLAAPLLEAGLEVELLDQRFERDFWGALSKALAREGVQCVGINFLSLLHIHSILEISRFVRERFPELTLVVGGTGVTSYFDLLLQERVADIAVIGEGEDVFPELLQRLQKSQSLDSLPGIARLHNGACVRHPPQRRVDPGRVTELPYQLIRKYLRRYDDLSLVTSRGCNYGCSFCHLTATDDPSWLPQDPKLTIRQIERILAMGRRYILFQDENFFQNHARTEAIVELARNQGLQFESSATITINSLARMEQGFIRELEAFGLDELVIGLESGSDRLLRLLRKSFNREMLEAVIPKLKGTSIHLELSFMVNLPTETPAETRETLDLVARLRDELPNVQIYGPSQYIPFPNTELYDVARRDGFVPPETLLGWRELFLSQRNIYGRTNPALLRTDATGSSQAR